MKRIFGELVVRGKDYGKEQSVISIEKYYQTVIYSSGYRRRAVAAFNGNQCRNEHGVK